MPTPCPKCGGFRVPQTEPSSEPSDIKQIRCVNCGKIEEYGHIPNTRIIKGQRNTDLATKSEDDQRIDLEVAWLLKYGQPHDPS